MTDYADAITTRQMLVLNVTASLEAVAEGNHPAFPGVAAMLRGIAVALNEPQSEAQFFQDLNTAWEICKRH